MNKLLPKARTADILEQEAVNELMIYDLRINKAYNLNETSKTVYLACDGKTSFDELKRRHKLTGDLIHFALAELASNNLLTDYESDHFAGFSRREIIKRVGLASMTALPVIASIAAPAAASAASLQSNNTICTSSAQCSSRRCIQTANTGMRCCANTNAPGIPIVGTGTPVNTTGGQANCDYTASLVCCSGTGTDVNGQCFCN